jgi:hypothetical protein
MSNTLWPAPVQSVLECKIPAELDVLQWKAIGRIRRRKRRRYLPCRKRYVPETFDA